MPTSDFKTSRCRFTSLVSAVAVLACALSSVVGPGQWSAARATTLPIGANGQGTLLVVGDSLTVGTDYFGKLSAKLSALGIWNKVVVDAKVGRKTGAGGDELKKLLKTYPNTTAVVIALGTNDMIVHSERSYPTTSLQNILSVSGNLPILWINPTFSATIHPNWVVRAQRMSALLASTSTMKSNFYVADWAKYFTPKGPSRYISDGVHLTVSGYKTRTSFMVNQVLGFGQTIVLSTTTTTTTTATSTSTSSTTTPSTTTTTVVPISS